MIRSPLRILPLLLVAACAAPDPEMPATTQMADDAYAPTDAQRAAVVGTVQRLFDALGTGDADLLREVMAPDVVMYSTETRDGETTFASASVDGLAERISVHTDSVQGFLEQHDGTISRFVLLDHMDWLSDKFFHLLESEWQAILDRASDGARAIWRSGGLRTDFIDDVRIRAGGKVRGLNDLLTYHDELAQELHAQDRVHTYGSFYIADIAA